MRALAQLLLAAVLTVACAAQGGDAADRAELAGAPGERLAGVAGHVRKVSDAWWGLVPATDEGTVYAPEPPLAAELREDGLPVRFSGVVGEVPPNVRLWGTPLREAEVEPR